MKTVYQIDDLGDRANLDAGSAKPARLAIIGHPVEHSASPEMQQAALDALGIDARYIRIEVPPGRVAKALQRMRELGFTGCNVTVPHKLEVMACCDTIDPRAALLGAVNTVRFDGDSTSGWNTDGPGFVTAVRETLGLGLRGARVAIIGAGGGAGRALAVQCALEAPAALTLVNRSADKLPALVQLVSDIAPACQVRALALGDPAMAPACRECDLIVNATSVGLKPGDPPVLGADCLRPGQALYDCVYRKGPTPLLELAASTGCRAADGRSMLLHQGALAFSLWFPGGADPLPYMAGALAGH